MMLLKHCIVIEDQKKKKKVYPISIQFKEEDTEAGKTYSATRHATLFIY